MRKHEDDDKGRTKLVEKDREEKGTKNKMKDNRMKKWKKRNAGKESK